MRILSKLWAIALLIFGLSILCFAQDEIIRVETTFVSVPVTVFDRDGRQLTNLKASDFKIFENGVEQQVSYFEPTEAPVTVMLLADVSGSMTSYKAQLGRAMDVFISQLRPDDTIIVATFANAPDLEFRVDPIKKKDYVSAKPPQPQGKFMTPAYTYTVTSDAVDQAIKYMKKLKGRRAIVLFGDADPSGRFATPDSNLKDAEEQEATFYTIRYGEYPPDCILDDHSAVVSASNAESLGAAGIVDRKDLNRMGKLCAVRMNEIPKLIERVDRHFLGLAEKTGGRGYHIADVSDLPATFTKVISELSQQYVIGYTAGDGGKDGERRKITVKVNIPNVAIRSRNEVVFKKK